MKKTSKAIIVLSVLAGVYGCEVTLDDAEAVQSNDDVRNIKTTIPSSGLKTDLSAPGTANCYLIKEAGSYNSVTDGRRLFEAFARVGSRSDSAEKTPPVR